MVGNVPLPTVWDQDTSYQTVFPYVDFEDVAYRRSESVDRFESTENIIHPQAEVWHGLMTWGDDPQIYHDYFAKLQTYDRDPSSFVDKRLWVDDFTSVAGAIDPDTYNYYLQQSIFAEDLNYHRYTPLLLSILQGVHDDRVAGALSDMGGLEALPLAGDASDDFVSALNQYTTFLSNDIMSQGE
ncbi:MAG: hypothetical protein H6766_06980 [Candidatus Peribacteria bacterium]|nr:MAG: hypothetical protein H6766_06980 [Candidatus Peribacteria bacterium]